MMKRATAAGANIIDVVAYPFMTDLDRVLANNPVATGVSTTRLKIGGVKITVDGSPQGRPRAFTSPYLTGGPGGQKNWKGDPTMPQESHWARRAGYDMGGRSSSTPTATPPSTPEGLRGRAPATSRRPWNVTTIHTQFIRKDQIPTFVKYKIRPSFYTLHTFYFADAHTRTAAPSRRRTSARCARRSTPGCARPTTPTSTSRRRPAVHDVVGRQPLSRRGALARTSAITPMEALKAQTLWAADHTTKRSQGLARAGRSPIS